MSVEVRALRERFWERFSLGELNAREWEALCDGCGQCCLMREVDEDRGEVIVYGVACELLDIGSSRCSDYSNRLRRVESCHKLTAENVPHYHWLPKTCAYRRVHKGKPLEPWHPLIAGDHHRMHQQRETVSSFALPAKDVSRRQMSRHVVDMWSIPVDTAKQRRRARK